MALEVIVTKNAEEKLDNIVRYLENNWGNKVKNKFLNQLKKNVGYISEYPYLFPESENKKGIRKCVLNKYTTMFYRVDIDRIMIVTFHQTTQDPDSIEI